MIFTSRIKTLGNVTANDPRHDLWSLLLDAGEVIYFFFASVKSVASDQIFLTAMNLNRIAGIISDAKSTKIKNSFVGKIFRKKMPK